MVAYSFKRRFVRPIKAGLGLIGAFHHNGVEIPVEFTVDDKTGKSRPFDPVLDLDPPVHPKHQTIRADRKRHARPGDELQLYCGMRTKQCFLIGRARCVSARSIYIQFRREIISIEDYPAILNGDLNPFALADGFENWESMRQFWREEHADPIEFSGVIIKWEALP